MGEQFDGENITDGTYESDSGGPPEGNDPIAEPETGTAEPEPGGESSPDAEQAYRELNDKYVRLYAEFDNFRKRVVRERQELLMRATEKVISDLLTVADHLELALQHKDGDSVEAVVQGVEITLREFRGVLERNGVSPIDAEGKPFDPTVHHAMSQVERDDLEENIVVEEFRKGYLLGERVLRPALVSVSKRPEADATDSAAPVAENETEE